MTYLSDDAIRHLKEVVDLPDFGGTRYEVLERIARGGMGVVYRARDLLLEREVALKVQNANAGGTSVDDDSRERMLREAKILAALEHPGIVPVHDVGRLPDGRVYYAMKLVKGEPLDSAGRKAGSLSDRLVLFDRICETVAFAHAQGVIHRDLKPENIMVGSFGEVLVVDWGIAKAMGRAGLTEPSEAGGRCASPAGALVERGTGPGAILGTPGYMSPEQERGEIESIDHRSDVYALGAILRFLLAGVHPGTQDPSAAAAGRVVPRPLRSVCRKAMAADPAGRYQSASALADDVRRFRAGEPVLAHREGPIERTARVYQRYRVPILLVFAYLVMRVVLFLFFRR